MCEPTMAPKLAAVPIAAELRAKVRGEMLELVLAERVHSRWRVRATIFVPSGIPTTTLLIIAPSAWRLHQCRRGVVIVVLQKCCRKQSMSQMPTRTPRGLVTIVHWAAAC